MAINYYLSVFPMEALIASQLDPRQFGSYMATGSKRGFEEQLIFMSVKGNFGDYFDWDYAAKRCLPHKNGDPKHSVYLSVYRVLEHIPFEQLGSLFLTTRDGRTLELRAGDYRAPEPSQGYYIYQELCPIDPVVVSSLDPSAFAKNICDPKNKIHVPKMIYANLKVIDFGDSVNTGNIGRMYSKDVEHLRECIERVTSDPTKLTKTFTRTNVESFSFQVISGGIYASDGRKTLTFAMPSVEEIKRNAYDWGRSALLI